MISWLVIAILVILAIFILKMNHMKHRLWVILIVLFVLFLYVSITLVNNKYDLDFSSTEGIVNSVKIYFGWLGNGFRNMESLVGNAIKMDWASSNESMLDTKNISKTSNSLNSNPNVRTRK